MKKISIIALAALAMISCGNTYKVKTVELTSCNDSVNYGLGLVTGYQIKMQGLANDSSDKAVAEFIAALDRGYKGKVEELSQVASQGHNIGNAMKEFEKKGLLYQAAWTLNEKVLFCGLVNGLLHDSVMMQPQEADMFVQMQYQRVASMHSEAEVGKPVKAKCGKKITTISLNTFNDSINYAFGVRLGGQMAMYFMPQDTTGEEFEELVDAINKALKTRTIYPQLVASAENIGKMIHDQEADGLLNIASLTTDYELIRQGFINGLHQDESQWSCASASEYIESTITELRSEGAKVAGEQFLAENKLREGVITTESGLQYEVITMGKGNKPKATDRVKVHYHGTLIDGTVFDSSVERGEPITFPLNGVIAGWTEGVQLMPVGSKFRFFIPYQLAYGERGAGASIPPYAALIFEVELIEIEK